MADIGLPHDRPADAVRLAGTPARPLLDKADGAHKYGHGHALVLSGGAGRSGAARLAARGALRVGAGLVTLGVPGSAQQEVACQITALMLRRIDDAAQLRTVLEDPRITRCASVPGWAWRRARRWCRRRWRRAGRRCWMPMR